MQSLKLLARYRRPWGAVLALLLAVAYGLDPIDLIPDFIPVIGLMDDTLVIVLLVALAIKLLRKPRPKPSLLRMG